MVRFVVEHCQFVDLAHQLAEIDVAVGGLADGLGAEGRKEVVAQIVIVQRRFDHVTEIDAVDIGQEQIAGGANQTYVVLDVQRDLKVIPPVLAVEAVVREHRIVEEDFQAIQVAAQAVEHDDVRCDQQDIARQRRIGFIELVEIAPCNQQREHLGLAGTSRHLGDVARPAFVEHAGGHGA